MPVHVDINGLEPILIGQIESPGIEHEVDAISGGTKTSDGVTAMLYNSMEHYLPLLEAKRKAAVEQVVFAPVRDESNQENVGNNE